MENDLSHRIIGAAIEVHHTLGGPGLIESVYESSFCHELELRGMNVQRQVPVQVKYKDKIVREPLFIDLLVDKKVIIEIKAIEKTNDIHNAQLLTYLRLTGLKLGLLINFGQLLIKDGIHRIVNRL